MSRFLLVILLSSLWVTHVTLGCETGVAIVKSVLSVPRSLMANADVALLKAYNATSVQKCMEDCCSGTYGKCSIASFQKNTSLQNCLHFYCRPLSKCRFMSSNSTDSFSFSNKPLPPSATPSTHNKTPTSTAVPQTTAEAAIAYSEQEAQKNDNTTIQPRKGVNEFNPNALLGRSGIKPRKGVSNEDIPYSKLLLSSMNKSNVKPRKGVEEFSSYLPTTTVPSSDVIPTNKVNINASVANVSTKNPLSSLEKVFEDDPLDFNVPSETSSSTPSSSYTPTSFLVTKEKSITELLPSKTLSQPSTTPITSEISTPTRQFVSEAVEEVVPTSTSMAGHHSTTQSITASLTESSHANVHSELSLSRNHSQTNLETTSKYSLPSNELFGSVKVSIPEEFRDDNPEEEEEETTENERKYKSSIHLVLSLVFGLLVLFAVLGVVAKRVYDGWVRRDYHRMNYLIDGIYNGMD